MQYHLIIVIGVCSYTNIFIITVFSYRTCYHQLFLCQRDAQRLQEDRYQTRDAGGETEGMVNICHT